VLQVQKFETIGRMAGGVAHDFNNLLTIVMGHSDFLLKKVGESHPLYTSLSAIRSASQQCAELTEQLLAIGRRQPMHPEHINLNSVIAGQEAILRNMVGPAVDLTTDLDLSLGPIYADPAQIRRVLANLATNARDAMPKGGKLILATASVEVADRPDSHSPGVPPGQYVRLSAADTGIGLTEEVKTRMFDPFYTTKGAGKGTGLGLSTVYGIVTQSGGYILVHSEPGAGARFEILFPRVDPTLRTNGPSE